MENLWSGVGKRHFAEAYVRDSECGCYAELQQYHSSSEPKVAPRVRTITHVGDCDPWRNVAHMPGASAREIELVAPVLALAPDTPHQHH